MEIVEDNAFVSNGLLFCFILFYVFLSIFFIFSNVKHVFNAMPFYIWGLFLNSSFYFFWVFGLFVFCFASASWHWYAAWHSICKINPNKHSYSIRVCETGKTFNLLNNVFFFCFCWNPRTVNYLTCAIKQKLCCEKKKTRQIETKALTIQ